MKIIYFLLFTILSNNSSVENWIFNLVWYNCSERGLKYRMLYLYCSDVRILKLNRFILSWYCKYCIDVDAPYWLHVPNKSLLNLSRVESVSDPPVLGEIKYQDISGDDQRDGTNVRVNHLHSFLLGGLKQLLWYY